MLQPHVFLLLVLAEESGGVGGSNLAVLAQYGGLGVVTALLIWFAKTAHQRERDRSDKLEEENRRLNALILDRVIPALTSATRAAEESAELLNSVQREREYAAREIRRGTKGSAV